MAAILGCSAGASAQAIYRQVDAAGHIVFSDRPDPALRVVTRFLPPSGRSFGVPRLRFSAIDADQDTRSNVDNALSMGSAISSPQSIGVDFNEAARRLQQARLNRKQGARVNLGEQVPGASPGALNEHYWLRQEMLQRQLDEAGRRYSEARLPR